MDNLPDGVWNGDPRAPWNQPDPPECPECGACTDEWGRCPECGYGVPFYDSRHDMEMDERWCG